MNRGGFSLPELLTAMALGGLVCTALVGALSSAERLTRQHGERVERGEMLRVAEAVLAGEVRGLDPRTDVRAVADDSLSLRAFRGHGIVCAREPGAVVVRYRGVRGPEPAKDSLLVLDADGSEWAVALEKSDRVQAGCLADGDEALYRWPAQRPPRVGTLILLFESGSYHFADDALRYRRGLSGRQPLTAELVSHRTSTFRLLTGARALEVEIAMKPTRGARPGRSARLRFGLLNGPGAGSGSGAP